MRKMDTDATAVIQFKPEKKNTNFPNTNDFSEKKKKRM